MARMVRLAAGVITAAGLAAFAREGPRAQVQDPNHETRTAAVALTAAESRCRISDDPTYGTTKDNPIKTGGGMMYLAARQVRYLSALRGPAGEGVHFVRQGSHEGGNGVFIDAYKVEYTGGKAITLYIDGYHWDAPVAPRGLMCGIDLNLPPPGPDPMETTAHMRTLAVGLSETDAAPISIDPDGSKTHGFVFDHARLIAQAARAAAAAGTPLDPERLPRDVIEPRLIAVAIPRTCAGAEQVPRSVTIADKNGNAPRVIERVDGDAVGKRLPGFAVPAHAVAVAYAASGLIDGARVVIEYADRCSEDEPREVLLPVKVERGRVLRSVPAVAPAGAVIPPAGAQVQLQVFLLADGTPDHPVFMAGAWELRDAAIEAVRNWRIEPPRHNGSPVLQTSTVTIRIAR